MQGNGQSPTGFRAPVRQALTRKHLVAGIPRDLGAMLLMFCLGLGLLLNSWGAIGVFFLCYGCMYYLTKCDPWWPEVWRDYLLLWMAVHPRLWCVMRRSALGLLVVTVLLVCFW